MRYDVRRTGPAEDPVGREEALAMNTRALRFALALTALSAMAALPVAAAAQARPATAAYKAPRNAFGQPDFSGVWSNATITPLERNPQLGDRLILTEAEAAQLEGANAQRNVRANSP